MNRKQQTYVSVLATACVLVLGASGCVTKSEYEAFVKSARRHQDIVAPRYRQAIEADVNLHKVTKGVRLKEDEDFERALRAAEKRLGLRQED